MLEPGTIAPDFEMQDASGKTWRLSDLRGRKVILYFYPADDTPGCTAQSCDFRDASPNLDAAGFTILGVSPQGADSHRRFAEKYGLQFPLLIDEGLATTRAYGAYKDLGNYEDVPLRVKRSTFVIAEYGVKARGHVAELLEKLGVPA
jgi:thioredoxin-dependent peroxiredoxin